MSQTTPSFTTQRLAWRDSSLGVITLANGNRMRLTLGLGSGLSQRPGDPKVTVWAIADRGPNLKIKPAIKRYGLEHLRPLAKVDGARIMPRRDVGPTICQIRLHGNAVKLVRRIPLRGVSGRPISGLPIPAGIADVEPAFDLKGAALGTDPSGADTEAIVALSDGTFWIGDEYGPSLLHVGPEGDVLQRWVPKGLEKPLQGADYVVKGVLPAIALRRRIIAASRRLRFHPMNAGSMPYSRARSPIPVWRRSSTADTCGSGKSIPRRGTLPRSFSIPWTSRRHPRPDVAPRSRRRPAGPSAPRQYCADGLLSPPTALSLRWRPGNGFDARQPRDRAPGPRQHGP